MTYWSIKHEKYSVTVWLNTATKGQNKAKNIIQSWMNMKSPGSKMECVRKNNVLINLEPFQFDNPWQLEAVQLDVKETTVLNGFDASSVDRISEGVDLGSKAYRFCLKQSQASERDLPSLKVTLKVSPDKFMDQVIFNVQFVLDYAHT